MSRDDDDPIFDLTDAGEADRAPRRGRRAPAAERELAPPSDKQLAFARKLAEERAVALPVEVEADRAACSAFLDKMLASPKAGAPAGPRPPSDKQLAFAGKLANERGIDLPDDARRDAKACSAFIDTMLADKNPAPAPAPAKPTAKPATAAPARTGGGVKPPSDKQIGFAQKLARDKKLRLPPGYQSDWRVCRDFIDAALGKSPADDGAPPPREGDHDGGPPFDDGPPW